ncbi:MAG: hypothetical protein Q9175_001735 [Cornicularia normoerica]
MGLQEDTRGSLKDIRDQHGGSLIPQLLEIQKHRITEAKWLEWARNPPCLCRLSEKPSRKRRRGADSTQITNMSMTFRRTLRYGADYVAVSYTSQPSGQESTAAGGYSIMDSAKGDVAVPSRVRDRILHRASKYAAHHGIDFIWIDDECINRDNPDEHEMAMQSMDLIYSFSRYPVGLLTKPIESQKTLDLLNTFLHSDFLKTSGHQYVPALKPELSVEAALEVLEVLDYITSDKWWTRAWIFQEDYRSSVKMNLLIPHSLCLRNHHDHKKWCGIPGELQVNSAAFHVESTRFCLAFLRKAGDERQSDRARCEDILKRAGRYNVLYQHGYLASKAMSPFIFADIGSRNISVASDLLAIAANCCDYSVRLNTKSLNRTSCSLSISILALFLLNGEVIMTHRIDQDLLSKNVFDYLRLLALDNFDPPVENKELTFLKSCRLVDVRLSPDGIVTSGRLWKLYKAINTDTSTFEMPSEKEFRNGLNAYQRSRLRYLSVVLQLQGHERLAVDLEEYLHEDAKDLQYPSKQYKDLMAESVVEAIKNRKTMYLG